MDSQDDLERYETTEAQDLMRLFSALRSPPDEHAPAHFRWWAWLTQAGTSPWVPALATGLLLSVGLNTWLGYQVLERRMPGAVPALSGRSDPAQRPGEEVSRGEEPGDSTFTFRGGPPVETPQHPEEARLSAEAELVRTLTALAARHTQAGQYERGMTVASAALTLDPNAAPAYFYRGMAYNGMGNRPQAIEDVRRAARLGEVHAQEVLRAWGVD